MIYTLYLIEMPFRAFANKADPDQATLVRAARSGSILFAYGNMIKYDPTQVDLTSNFFVLCTSVKVYIISHSGWSFTWIFMKDYALTQILRVNIKKKFINLKEHNLTLHDHLCMAT